MALASLARQILADISQRAVAVALPMVELWPTGDVIINALSVTNATTSGAQQVTFPCDGICVGIAATVETGAAADMAGFQLAVAVDGQFELFTTGSARAYKPFAQISGVGAVGAVSGYWKCRIPFRQATAWQAFVKNTTAGTQSVDVAFAYVNTSTPRS